MLDGAMSIEIPQHKGRWMPTVVDNFILGEDACYMQRTEDVEAVGKVVSRKCR